uniref:Uncharacterized protein n=1 Tax=Glossina morsitans morsitans TaxID=37546 RepID=A0A1B0FE70_GLOMM
MGYLIEFNLESSEPTAEYIFWPEEYTTDGTERLLVVQGKHETATTLRQSQGINV